MALQCDMRTLRGVVNLTGNIPNDVNTIPEPPLRTAFAPKISSLPSNHNSILTEDATSSSTCSFTGFNYSLLQMQMCQPVHVGFTFPNTSCHKSKTADINPVAEFILSFQPTARPPSTLPYNLQGIVDYDLLMLCFPVYGSTGSSNADYLTQLIPANYGTKPELSSLDSLFSTSQFGLVYGMCCNTTTSSRLLIKICVFPIGIEMLKTDYAALTMAIPPTPYVLPDAISPSFNLLASTSPQIINSNTTDYKNWIQTFTIKAKNKNATDATDAQNTTMPYKCIPIDSFQRDHPNIAIDLSKDGVSLKDLYKNCRIDNKSEYFDQLKTQNDNVTFWCSIAGAVVVFGIIRVLLTKHE
jgi:hypothetical protein